MIATFILICMAVWLCSVIYRLGQGFGRAGRYSRTCVAHHTSQMARDPDFTGATIYCQGCGQEKPDQTRALCPDCQEILEDIREYEQQHKARIEGTHLHIVK